MLRGHSKMQPLKSQTPATKAALIHLAMYSLLIADTAAIDCISITRSNLQCITLDANNSAVSQCLIPPPNTQAYKLLCDGTRNCPVDIDEGNQGNRGGQSFNPTLMCCEYSHISNSHQVLPDGLHSIHLL